MFDTQPNASTNKDAIMDFRAMDDTVLLDNAVFKKAGSNGTLKASAFWISNTGKAHDPSDRVVYDKDSGVLYYDADGSGSGAGIAIATISKNLAMTNKDFLVNAFPALGENRREALKIAAGLRGEDAFNAGVAEEQALETVLPWLSRPRCEELVAECLELYCWDRLGSEN